MLELNFTQGIEGLLPAIAQDRDRLDPLTQQALAQGRILRPCADSEGNSGGLRLGQRPQKLLLPPGAGGF